MCFKEVRIYRQGWIEKHANGSPPPPPPLLQPFHCKKKFFIEPANEKPCQLLKQREVFILTIFVKSLFIMYYLFAGSRWIPPQPNPQNYQVCHCKVMDKLQKKGYKVHHFVRDHF